MTVTIALKSQRHNVPKKDGWEEVSEEEEKEEEEWGEEEEEVDDDVEEVEEEEAVGEQQEVEDSVPSLATLPRLNSIQSKGRTESIITKALTPSDPSAPLHEGPFKGKIFIKTLTGKTLTLDVESSYTIKDVMAKIETVEGHTYQHVLIFDGKKVGVIGIF